MRVHARVPSGGEQQRPSSLFLSLTPISPSLACLCDQGLQRLLIVRLLRTANAHARRRGRDACRGFLASSNNEQTKHSLLEDRACRMPPGA